MGEQDDIRIERVATILDALKSAELSAEARDKLQRELDHLGRVVDPDFAGKMVIYSVTEGVFDWLIHRQESIPLDFDAIRRQKAELDRKLFGRHWR